MMIFNSSLKNPISELKTDLELVKMPMKKSVGFNKNKTSDIEACAYQNFNNTKRIIAKIIVKYL